MNNSFYDEANKITYIIPASHQISRSQAELAIDLALESYADSALIQHLSRYPDTKQEEHETLKQKFRAQRIAKHRGSTVLIAAHSTELPEVQK